MAYERVKSEVIVNIDRFTSRLEFALTLPEFAHSNKITHPGLDEAASIIHSFTRRHCIYKCDALTLNRRGEPMKRADELRTEFGA